MLLLVDIGSTRRLLTGTGETCKRDFVRVVSTKHRGKELQHRGPYQTQRVGIWVWSCNLSRRVHAPVLYSICIGRSSYMSTSSKAEVQNMSAHVPLGIGSGFTDSGLR